VEPARTHPSQEIQKQKQKTEFYFSSLSEERKKQNKTKPIDMATEEDFSKTNS
jgi:hypothetical protein